MKKGIEKRKCSLFIAYFQGRFTSQNYFCKDYNKELRDKFFGQYAYHYLDWYLNVQVVSTNVHFVDGDVSCKSDEISLVNRAKLEIEVIIDTFCSSITSIMKY